MSELVEYSKIQGGGNHVVWNVDYLPDAKVHRNRTQDVGLFLGQPMIFDDVVNHLDQRVASRNRQAGRY